MADQPELADLQRWMAAQLCRPDGADAARFEIAQVVTASATLSAGQRMDLYRRGYRLRLLECLRAMHPALRHALGYPLFDAFALDYLECRVSRSYSLFGLGEAFSQHLENTRPEPELWTDFVIDVVRFEQAFLHVYDGEGPEGRLGATLDLAADRSPLALGVVPGVRLFASPYPVGEFVLAVRRGEHPELPSPRPSWAALARRDYVVIMVPLERDAFDMLEALLGGAHVGRAAQSVGASPSQVRAWLGDRAAHGLIWEKVSDYEIERVPTPI